MPRRRYALLDGLRKIVSRSEYKLEPSNFEIWYFFHSGSKLSDPAVLADVIDRLTELEGEQLITRPAKLYGCCIQNRGRMGELKGVDYPDECDEKPWIVKGTAALLLSWYEEEKVAASVGDQWYLKNCRITFCDTVEGQAVEEAEGVVHRWAFKDMDNPHEKYAASRPPWYWIEDDDDDDGGDDKFYYDEEEEEDGTAADDDGHPAIKEEDAYVWVVEEDISLLTLG